MKQVPLTSACLFLSKEKYKFAVMDIVKKNTTKKIKKEKQASLPNPWHKTSQGQTLFPEKLAKANQILRNTKMLP
jgi:hypothetical protein